MGFKFQMGMGMKSLKWEGIGTKNLFPHTSPLRCALLRLASKKRFYQRSAAARSTAYV